MSDDPSNEELLEDLRRVAEEIGTTPSYDDYFSRGSFHPSTITHRFESWNEAIRRIGLEPNEEFHGNPPTDPDRSHYRSLLEAAREKNPELRTDGGIDPTERWREQAEDNLDKWGEQSIETLLLSIPEELGELTRSVLEYRSEGANYGPLFDELHDLGALLIQLHGAISGHRFAVDPVRADGGQIARESIDLSDVEIGDRVTATFIPDIVGGGQVHYQGLEVVEIEAAVGDQTGVASAIVEDEDGDRYRLIYGGAISRWNDRDEEVLHGYGTHLERELDVVTDGGSEVVDRGHAPDDRDIDDILAVELCESCGWEPAAVILVNGNWECYNCGHDPDETIGTEDTDRSHSNLRTDGGSEVVGRERLPEFVDEARVAGGTARCRGCGFTIRFEGFESHELARELWFGEEHRRRHE